MPLKSGVNVKLVPFSPEHAEKVSLWYYGYSYQSFFREFEDMSLSMKNFEHFDLYFKKEKGDLLVIVELQTMQPIGLMTYECIKKKAKIFRFGILLDEAWQNKTYAIEAIILLTFFLVEDKDCHKLVVEFLAKDKHIQRISEQGGFEREAYLKEEAIIDGQYVDEVRYRLSKEKLYELYGDYYQNL